uniref:NamL1 n=1 Tax=Streptomyces sp. LZ35 TaxID=1245024 RepID=A0A068ELV3_9ACTN|nr:NamL1 [Streptomyces sp. LZ35]
MWIINPVCVRKGHGSCPSEETRRMARSAVSATSARWLPVRWLSVRLAGSRVLIADHSGSTPRPSGQQPPHHARADLGGEPVLDARARLTGSRS